MTNDLSGVVRVRGVRERDSRLGLAQALREQSEAARRVSGLHDDLRATAAFERGDAATYLAHAARIDAVGRAITEAERQLAVARGVVDAARARWQDDRARLRSVELLRERRTEAHRRELARRLTAQLDDLAAQRWARGSERSTAR